MNNLYRGSVKVAKIYPEADINIIIYCKSLKTIIQIQNFLKNQKSAILIDEVNETMKKVNISVLQITRRQGEDLQKS